MALMPAMAWADDSGTCGENLTWTYEEATKRLTISGEGEMEGYGWGYFNNGPWSSYSSVIRNVVIQEGVTSIGSAAFQYFRNLTSISLPSTLIFVRYAPFSGCSSLTSVCISDLAAWCEISFEGIQSNPLSYANHLYLNGKEVIDLDIPSSVTSIGDYAFSGCTGLTSTTIPSSVTSIGGYAFSECTSLNSVTIGEGATSIGDYAFSGCTSLNSVTIGEGAISIGDYAFSGCTSLNSVTIGEGAISIGDNAFAECTGLVSIVIPTGVNSIGEKAFYRCASLTSVSIPSSVNSIGEDAFADCLELSHIRIESGNPVYDSRDDCNAIIRTVNNELLKGCKTTIIPSTVTKIGDRSFSNCLGLTSIEIPEGATTIGNSAFAGCVDLSFVSIPSTVVYLGEFAFYFCKGLSSITIPGGITKILSHTFSGCTGLTSVTLSETVSSIEEAAFSGSGLTSLTIPSSVTSIGYMAFDGCVNLESVVFSDGLRFLGQTSFSGCTSLTSVTIPSSVTSIGSYAFYNCTGLTSLVLMNGITNINEGAFSGCSSLTKLIIPASVKNIGRSAFSGCSSLLNVYCYALSAPNAQSNAFDGSLVKNPILYVPESSILSYMSMEPWRKFVEIYAIKVDAEQCATPTIYYNSGKLSFKSDTDGVTFVSEIKDADVKKFYDSEIALGVTYNISVYATRDGYKDSEVATATLCWIDVEPQKEGISDDEAVSVKEMKAQPVLIQRSGNGISVTGAPAGTPIAVYDLSGQLLGCATATAETTRVQALNGEKVVVVKIGERAVKVAK